MTKAPETGPATASSNTAAGGLAPNQQASTSAANPPDGAAGVETADQPQNQPTPKDGQVIVAIMNELGITDYEPAVVTQLLEFVYRYVTDLVEDASKVSQYASKNQIDGEDMRLAVQMAMDKTMTGPPPRDILAEIAQHKNGTALPQIKSHNGPRLPADRYSLIAPNHRLRSGLDNQPNIVLNTRPSYFQSTLSGLSGQRIPGQKIQIIPQGGQGTTVTPVGSKRKVDE